MDRLKGFLLIALSYVLACVPAYFVFEAVYNGNTLFNITLSLLIADIVATVIVWFFGIVFKNSSFYDPYWSLMPFLLMLFLMIRFGLFGISNLIFISALGIWSWRLTLNWAYTFKSLKVQDWRYEDYKKNNSPLVWHLINFFGINMIPTFFVFFGIMPGIALVIANSDFKFFTLVGAATIIGASVIEFLADASMHKFKNTIHGSMQVMDKGLWRFSRHPNYFGEISVWFGVYFFMLAVAPDKWFLFFGALGMIVLFLFISIPLAEKRQLARRPDYAEYKNRVSMLIPLPNKKIKKED